MKTKRKINKGYLFIYIVLTLYTLYTIYPLFLMIITSLKPNLEIMKNPSGLPTSLYLDGFKTLFGKMDFSKYLINTTFVTIVSCVALLVISLMLSYVLARYKSRLSNFLYMFFLVGMMVPLRLGLPSLNDLLYNTGLIDNLWGLIFIYIAINLSYTMLLLTGFTAAHPSFPRTEQAMDALESWAAGHIVGDTFVVDESFRRSARSPELPLFCLLPAGDGLPAVSTVDAAGRRRVFKWVD